MIIWEEELDINAEIVTGAPNAPASMSQLGVLQPSQQVWKSLWDE